jgi:LAS superfamily LD-carboxypeptidase LdcB
MTFTPSDIKITDSILEKAEPEKMKSAFRVVTFDNFYKLFNDEEKKFIKQILAIDPNTYGFKGRSFGISDVPQDLVEITEQKYQLSGTEQIIDTQYLPKKVYDAYQELNQSLFKKEKKNLLILSGYRSPAYQTFVFLWYLKSYEFNLQKTIKRAALPGYSEHGFPKRQAIDFITEEGKPSEENPEDFEHTVEFNWLKENANKFKFYLTNPRENELGTMYEPWHWAYILET